MSADTTGSGSGPRSPEEIREEIEQTREQMGDTVEALAEKTDVKKQAKNRIDTAKATVKEKREHLVENVKQATPESAGAGAQQVAASVQSRPVPVAVAGAFGAGVVIGWALGRR